MSALGAGSRWGPAAWASPAGASSGSGRRGRLRRDVSMAGLTAWGVGGPARRLFEPADAEDLCRFLATLPADEPLHWVGLGSNLLVRDGGLEGTVVLTTRGLGAISRRGENRVRAESGVACAKLARFCASQGLTGAEFLAGIPGTVGGALAMNAGAFAAATWDLVAAVETVDRHGRVAVRDAAEFDVSYRRVVGPPGEWFLAAELVFAAGDPAAARDRIRALLRERAASQPTGQRSCGSVFKNPPGDYAGRLVDSAGLKGARVGGAVVSDKHANFIINDGTASAADIEALIERVADAVEERHAVRLEPEVRIVGRRRRAEAGR